MSNDKPKTVVPPTRGPGGPHPAEVNEHLGLAYQLCSRLIEAAERRGDQAGADAWLVALRSIEAAEKTMRAMRELQTWRTVQGERVDLKPPYNVPCPVCEVAAGEKCRRVGGEGRIFTDDMIHSARANQIGVDLRPRSPTLASRALADSDPLGRTAERERLRQIAATMKHGPGGTGRVGPCDPHCLKCEAEAELEALGIVCDQGTPGCRGRGEKHACISGVR